MVIDPRRDADKLFQVIDSRPGLKHGDLGRRLQNWDADRLTGAIEWNQMLGRIRVEQVRPKRGPPATCYWPIEDWQPPAQEGQLQAARRELSEARQQLVKVTALIEAAEQRLEQLQAAEPAQPAVAA